MLSNVCVNLSKSHFKSCLYKNGSLWNFQPQTEFRRNTEHEVRASRSSSDNTYRSLSHFICLNDWSEHMIKNILYSALNLKGLFGDTHGKKTKMLAAYKVMLLEDHREPLERMALSKATSLLGADGMHITSKIRWEHDYYSRIFSEMADVIFVSAEVHGCMRNFAKHSKVPVMVMRSRVQASIQSMATIMSIMEEYGNLANLNIAYVGAPHPVLNDYLLLCPMFRANFVFKCSCSVCPVSPLMLDEGTCQCEKARTTVKQFTDTKETLCNANIIISGPTTKKKEKIPEFQLSVNEIQSCTKSPWTYYHTLPRGPEVDDSLFWHPNSRSFNAFKNMQFICAALILYSIKVKYIYDETNKKSKKNCTCP